MCICYAPIMCGCMNYILLNLNSRSLCMTSSIAWYCGVASARQQRWEYCNGDLLLNMCAVTHTYTGLVNKSLGITYCLNHVMYIN